MAYRPLEITVISADNLKDVNLMSKMDVYVAVSASGDPRTLRRTPVHKDAGKSPRWNHRLSVPVSDNLCVVFKVVSDRILGDREIGEVSVPVKELLDAAGNGGGGGERVVEYQVRTVSGKTQGTLKFSYKFGEKMASASTPNYAAPPPQYAAPPPYYAAAPPPPHYSAASKPDYASPKPDYSAPPPQYVDEGKSSSEPVTAYPAQAYAPPPPQHGYGYPPPQHGYGYPPPQQGYGYPPPQQGYGYPPPQQGYGYGGVPPKKKKQGMGGGLGLGLGAGLLGGLLVGDMISDAADYDGGFDDGGGFDF